MTGDTADITARLRSYLPAGWFPDDAPLLDAVLTGIAAVLSIVYSLYVFVKAQTRIATATGGWLDLIANDLFGTSLLRGFNETDDNYRTQIQLNLFRPRGTRQSVVDILTQLTGHAPAIFEPGRPADTGGYDVGGCGYNVAGGYGGKLTAQAFVIAYRPQGQGVPLLGGYGSPVGAYDTGSQLEYIDSSMYAGSSPDSVIYAAINSVRPAGVILWTRIDNWPPMPPVIPDSYPPPLTFDPPPENAVVTSDGSYVITSDDSYVAY